MTRRAVYRDLAVLASSLVFSVAALVFSLHAIDVSERKWCAMMGTLDEAYSQTPPNTPTGKEVAARIAELNRSLECP